MVLFTSRVFFRTSSSLEFRRKFTTASRGFTIKPGFPSLNPWKNVILRFLCCTEKYVQQTILQKSLNEIQVIVKGYCSL